MSTVTAKKPPTGYPYKGMADQSWPGCPNCRGFGTITQELAIAGAEGQKGDVCKTCNGVGRIPDPSWPKCACETITEDCAAVCGGLGMFSPAVQQGLRAKYEAAQAKIESARGELAAIERAASRGSSARRPE